MSIDDITRFELVITQAGNYLKSHPNGDWVSFDAHAEAVKAAYLAGLEAAKGKAQFLFSVHADKHKKTGGDPYHEGAADIADQCEQAIDQLIKEATPAESGPPKHEPTPAPAFGGPNDAEAVKWAEERGYRVMGYRHPSGNELFIANSNAIDTGTNQWHVLSCNSLAYGFRYILAPLAQPEPEPVEYEGTPINMGAVVDTYHRLNTGPIDRDLFELVKAMVTGLSSSCTQTDRDYIIHNAKHLLAEMRKEGK